MQQYRPGEMGWHADAGSVNPWTIPVLVRFEGPGGQRLAIPAFYDDQDTWRVRFTPPVSGTWRYTTECATTTTLHGQAARFEVAPAAGDNPLWRHGGILRVSADGHHLTHTDGTPFFWLGDTWWACPSDAMPLDGSNRPDIPSMFRHLVEIRRRQGFSVLHMDFLGTIRGTGVLDFCGARHGRPFDPAYWQAADRYLACANEAGLIPAIGLAWADHLAALDLDDLRHLWSYVVARYGAWAVTWLVCGEYNVALQGEAPERVAKALALGRHIKACDPYNRAMTIHPWGYWCDKRQAWTETWYDFIMFQSAHLGSGKTPPAALYLDAWNHDPPVPLIEGETNYEGVLKEPVSAEGVRLSAYHALQSGCAGFTYGAQGLWYPTQDETDQTVECWGAPIPWWKAVQQPGAEQMAWMRRCYESIPWWRTEPWPESLEMDQKRPCTWRWTPVKNAWPRAPELEQEEAASPIPLARGARDGTAALVYFPPAFPASAAVVLRWPKPATAPLRAEWFDPRTGVRQSVGLTPCMGDRHRLPDRPDDQDWVLVLRE